MSSPDEHRELPVPERYAIKRLLGQGGMGAVYLVEDEELSFEAALKVVRPEFLQESPEMISSLWAEIRTAARLYHRGIVPLYDAGQVVGAPYLVMRYIPGGSLVPLLRHPPPWRTLFGILRDILEALSFVHARGVLHRDLKPENILLDEQGRALLADLGIAFSLDILERVGERHIEVIGTPAYMAPEQFSKDPRDLGPWTDLYALGVLLFAITTGRRPFSSQSPRELFLAKRKGPPAPVLRDGLEAPPGLARVLERLLAPEPRQRYPLAADVLEALRALESPRRKPAQLPTLPPQEEASPLPSSLALFAFRDPGLTGRREERRLLWEKARAVQKTGAPHLLLVEGEAGVGKSRLLRWLWEWLERLGQARKLLVIGEDPRSGVLTGLSGALHRLLGSDGLPWEKVSARAALYLGASPEHPPPEAEALAHWLSPPFPRAQPLSPEERDVLFFRVLFREAERGLALVVWENLPRAAEREGPSTLLRALDLFARFGTRLPVLFLATARPEDWASSPHAKARERLLSRSDVTLLSLANLDEETQRELIETRLPIDEGLSQKLSESAEGNPLYAVELLRHWIRQGFLEGTPTRRFRLKEGVVPARALPASLRSLAEERIGAALGRAASPKQAEAMLLLAALLGVEVGRDVLETAFFLKTGEAEGWGALDLLLEEGLLRPTERARVYRFDRAVLRRVLLDRVAGLSDREHWHKVCAEALEGTRTDAASLSAAAAHWESAGEILSAARAFLRAGQRWYLSDLSQAEACYTQAERLAVSLGEAGRTLLAETKLGLGRVASQRQPSQARAHYEAALSLGEDRAFLAQAHVGLALAALQLGEADVTEQHSRKAKALAQEEGEHAVLAQSLILLGMLHLRRGDLKQATEQFLKARNQARMGLDRLTYVQTLYWMAAGAMQQKDFRKAEDLLREAKQLAISLGVARIELRILNIWGDLLRYQDRLGEARQSYLESRALARRLSSHSILSIIETNLALLALLQKDPEQGRMHLDSAYQLLPGDPHWLKAPLALLRALAAALSGEMEEAQRCWEESQALQVGSRAEADVALIAERLGDSSEGALQEEAYRFSLSQWKTLGRTEEVSRVEAKLSKQQTPGKER